MYTITALFTDGSTRTVHMPAPADDPGARLYFKARDAFDALCGQVDCFAAVFLNEDGDEVNRYVAPHLNPMAR